VPRFSLVVPTRDRPDLLDLCLESIASQTFGDFEVIVSDNPTQTPAKDVFDKWADERWRYVSPDGPLPMHENFERGCAETSGDYVGVVIDKTVLQPSALEFVDQALADRTGIDIVTWWNDGYNPVDEDSSVRTGRFLPSAEISEPTPYDPASELARRFANDERRGVDEVHYVRGKIVFGAYSQALLKQIRAVAGRVFHPLAPDYTAMVPACALAKNALDVGRPLLVSYNSRRSNGWRQSVDPVHARRFIEAVDPSIIEALPISGLYSSQHNVVAYDLVSAARRCPEGMTPDLNVPNLVRRAREDLEGVFWPDPEERDAQYEILKSAEQQSGITPVHTRQRASLTGPLRRIPLLRYASGRRNPPPPTYDSPVEAARAAERHYAVSANTS
jgi:Glycosyl transferase family 2